MRRASPLPSLRTPPRKSAFVTGLDLEPIDDNGANDVALGLVLPCWTLLGMLDRAILASWLELINGGVTWNQRVDTDGDRVLDAEFGQLIRSAEALRADPAATAEQRAEQRRLLSRAVSL